MQNFLVESNTLRDCMKVMIFGPVFSVKIIKLQVVETEFVFVKCKAKCNIFILTSCKFGYIILFNLIPISTIPIFLNQELKIIN